MQLYFVVEIMVLLSPIDDEVDEQPPHADAPISAAAPSITAELAATTTKPPKEDGKKDTRKTKATTAAGPSSVLLELPSFQTCSPRKKNQDL